MRLEDAGKRGAKGGVSLRKRTRGSKREALEQGKNRRGAFLDISVSGYSFGHAVGGNKNDRTA